MRIAEENTPKPKLYEVPGTWYAVDSTINNENESERNKTKGKRRKKTK